LLVVQIENKLRGGLDEFIFFYLFYVFLKNKLNKIIGNLTPQKKPFLKKNK